MQLSVNVRKMQQKMKNIWIVEFFEEVGIPKTQKMEKFKLRLKSKLILLIQPWWLSGLMCSNLQRQLTLE